MWSSSNNNRQQQQRSSRQPYRAPATDVLLQQHQHDAVVDTTNDESIARALAAADQEEADARLARQRQLLEEATFAASADEDNSPLFYPGQRRAPPPPTITAIPRGRIVGIDQPFQQQHQQVPPAWPQIPIRQQQAQRVPMCIVPCVIGTEDHDNDRQVCVEMLVDTGAETSVMSYSLVRELGLEQKLDRSQQGIACGVGQARILGRLKNVIVALGHVEFSMEFSVLDLPSNNPSMNRLLLLGLDQMLRYKCIVDLERRVLVFGGTGGVEVHMLPPEEQQLQFVPGMIGGQACCIS